MASSVVYGSPTMCTQGPVFTLVFTLFCCFLSSCCKTMCIPPWVSLLKPVGQSWAPGSRLFPLYPGEPGSQPLHTVLCPSLLLFAVCSLMSKPAPLVPFPDGFQDSGCPALPLIGQHFQGCVSQLWLLKVRCSYQAVTTFGLDGSLLWGCAVHCGKFISFPILLPGPH